MTKGSLNFFELHVEKFVLGAAGLFLVYLLFAYFISAPNVVEKGGNSITPSGVNDAVAAETDRLDQAIKRADHTPEERAAMKVQFDNKIKGQFEAGVLKPVEGAPNVPRQLASLAPGGRPMPSLGEDSTIGSEKVALVTPLAPSVPVAETGRSMVVRKVPKVGETPERAAGGAGTGTVESTPVDAGEAVELPWVSVAAYFDRAAQKNELTKAGYGAAQANVYVGGVDVERQEMLASGGWSDWTPVSTSGLMPALDVPAPVLDEQSGTLLNSPVMNAGFGLVKREQITISQPRFPPITAGDGWKIPPMEGYQTEEPEVEERAPEPPPKPTPAPQPQPGDDPGGREGGGGRTIGGGGDDGPGFPPSGPKGPNPAVEGRKKAAQDWRDARAAFNKKDYDAAKTSANAVVANEHAPIGTKKQAEKMLSDIKRIVDRPEIDLGPAPDVWVHHPDDPEKIAVWFHDDTVESGKTYRYRMRVKLWNRYVGRMRNVENVEDARQTLVAGDWSLPCDPITVTPSTYFFVRGGTKPSASVDVYKWRSGDWVKQAFEVEVGDTIGGPKSHGGEEVDFATGAIVLDLRFDEQVRQRRPAKEGFSESMQPSLVLVYMDPADGQVKERVQLYDRYDPTYVRLKEVAQ